MGLIQKLQEAIGEYGHASPRNLIRLNNNYTFINGEFDSIPAASDATRGGEFRTEGGTGVADVWVKSLKNSADANVNYYPMLSTTSNLAVAGLATDAIVAVINGAGSEIADGVALDHYVPYDCTITGVVALADQSGSIVVDIWRDVIANYPPTNADSITASAPVTITTDTDSTDTTLTGWTTSLSAGNTLRYNVDSCTTITRCTITLLVQRSI